MRATSRVLLSKFLPYCLLQAASSLGPGECGLPLERVLDVTLAFLQIESGPADQL